MTNLQDFIAPLLIRPRALRQRPVLQPFFDLWKIGQVLSGSRTIQSIFAKGLYVIVVLHKARAEQRVALDDPLEQIAWARPSDFGGWEYLIAEQSRHLWAIHHDSYAICACFNWGQEWTYRGKLHVLPGRGAMLMEPGELHRTLSVPDKVKFKVVNIPPGDIYAAASDWNAAGAPHLKAAQCQDPALMRAVWRLGLLSQSADRPPSLLVESLKTEVVRLFLRQCETRSISSKKGADRNSVERAKAYLDENLDYPVTLDEMAAVAGLSRYRLAHDFAKAMGLSPYAYHIHARIRRAREFLRVGMPSAEVAQQLGFVDQAHFTRHFKRIMRITPRAYAAG